MICDEDFQSTIMDYRNQQSRAVHSSFDITKRIQMNVMHDIVSSHSKRTAKRWDSLNVDSPKVFDEIKGVGV